MQDDEPLSKVLLSRTMGHFALSIATSLALEVTLGTGTAPEEKPTTVNELIKFDEVWFNLRTLARNIYNAVPASDKDAITEHDIATALDQEMTALMELSQSMCGSKPFVFYVSHNHDIAKKMKHALLRQPTTIKQIHQAECINDGIKIFLKTIRKREKELKSNPAHQDYESPVHEHDFSVKPKERKKVAVLTNHTLDLLFHEKFKQLTLLESHTGTLKNRDRWYTKFFNGRELDFIPFNAATLQFFGDTEVFKPYKAEVRAELLEIGKARNWNPMTTDERFLFSLSMSKNRFLTDTAKDMLHAI